MGRPAFNLPRPLGASSNIGPESPEYGLSAKEIRQLDREAPGWRTNVVAVQGVDPLKLKSYEFQRDLSYFLEDGSISPEEGDYLWFHYRDFMNAWYVSSRAVARINRISREIAVTGRLKREMFQIVEGMMFLVTRAPYLRNLWSVYSALKTGEALEKAETDEERWWIAADASGPLNLTSGPANVSPLKKVGRVRKTRSGRQQISLDTVNLTPAQLKAARALIGQKMTGAQRNAWQITANPREQRELANINRLWAKGTRRSQRKALKLARKAFDRHRARYWAAVRRDPVLRKTFEDAGMRFPKGKGAPVYDLPDGTVEPVTLEHSTRVMNKPARAVDADNLQFVLKDENSVSLEFIRNNDPFQP
jgi:hypothetical protein